MFSIKKKWFEIAYYAFVVLLVVSIFYFDKNYFINLTSNKEALQAKHLIIFYFGQVFLILLTACMILFREKILQKKKEVILLILTLAVVFLALEIFARFYVCNFGGENLQSRVLLPNQCNLYSRYSPHQYLDYYGTPNYSSKNGLNVHNSLGFRGGEIESPKPSSVYRIVIIGGSTVYSTGVEDWKRDFARQLQRELKEKYPYVNIEVINAGLAGWTSYENLINLEFKILPLEPDMVIIYEGIGPFLTKFAIARAGEIHLQE